MINLMSLARSETRSRKGRTKTSGERWRAKDFSNREAFYFFALYLLPRSSGSDYAIEQRPIGLLPELFLLDGKSHR